MFASYLAEFKNLNSGDAITQHIKAKRSEAEQLCDGVKKAVREYLHGFPREAFDAIKEAIQRVGTHMRLLRPNHDVARIDLLRELYRLRAEKPNEEPRGMYFSRKDLFHIPFEKRHLVTRQRYSIPGLPCLYLGSTLYVCWEELGRPPFHSLYAVRFRTLAGATITLLDFSAPAAATARFIEHNQSDLDLAIPVLVARAVCWPLVAACSIRRLNRDAPFIAEYIVPQLILQWVTRSDATDGNRLDGIVFFSVNADPLPDFDTALLNYVFPVQDPQPQGHCPALKAKFELSEPASWQLLESCGLGGGATVHSAIEIPIVHGTTAEYMHTPFGVVESRLCQLPCLPL